MEFISTQVLQKSIFGYTLGKTKNPLFDSVLKLDYNSDLNFNERVQIEYHFLHHTYVLYLIGILSIEQKRSLVPVYYNPNPLPKYRSATGSIWLTSHLFDIHGQSTLLRKFFLEGFASIMHNIVYPIYETWSFHKTYSMGTFTRNLKHDTTLDENTFHIFLKQSN